MNLLPLNEKDVVSLVRFEKENFSDGWTDEMFYSAFNTGRFFGFKIENESEIVGFITYSITDDSSDLESIVVKADYRGKGLGKLLIENYLNSAKEKGVKNFFLEVRKSNLTAISLYEKSGYKVINERKKYYADGENALVLKKEIL